MKTLATFSKNALLWFKHLLVPAAIVVLSGCAGDIDVKPEPVAPRKVVKRSSTTPAVDYALSLQGTPYIYGKASPEEGFDCSGFVKYVYERNGVHLPRTVREMSNALTPVANNNIHPGDLVFFNTSGNSVSHVGIYVNESNFVHAPSSRAGKVMVSSLKNNYWREHFIDARRPQNN
ncbi:MAG: C40 family peptidase [Methylococcales bacterium]|nr:C40 family peptidase [Methylococcales bacterium]MDD5753590.1 C40 family peptidase [Methylococcales bacterium]